MENLSDLNKKCLVNMPMMVDVISTTMNQLKSIFSSINLDIQECLNEELLETTNYSLDQNSIKEGKIYFFGEEDDTEELSPSWELIYCIPIFRTYRNKTYSFEVEFGYIADENQNVIFFQIKDNSINCNLLNETKTETILQQIPNESGKGGGEDYTYIEFEIDDTLTVEMINKYKDDFEKYILKPFMLSLKE